MGRDREHLAVIILPAHKAVLRRLAEANGEAVAVVVRRLIREEGERRGLWPIQAGQAQEGAAEDAA